MSARRRHGDPAYLVQEFVLDDSGDLNPNARIIVTEAGRAAVLGALGLQLPPASGVPFDDAYLAARWMLLLIRCMRVQDLGPEARPAWCFAAGRCAGAEAFRVALFAAWQLAGEKGVVDLVRSGGD